ncbi:MAG: hypothetical protein R2710_22350 [Acidimicrobiales bacterium]
MNPNTDITDPAPNTPRSRTGRVFVAAVAAGALLLAACSSDDTTDATADTSAETTMAPTETTMADESTTDDSMTEDEMSDEDMTDDSMSDGEDEMAGDMMGAFGPACDAVPTEGDGSFAGMADDTAATAASNNPLLSTLVTAVVEADLVDALNSD